MKKGLLTTVLLALGLLTAQGQTTVRGHIVNERGESEVTGGEAIRTDEGLHIRVTGETVTIRET